MYTARKEKTANDRKDLVNQSARAQEFLVKRSDQPHDPSSTFQGTFQDNTTASHSLGDIDIVSMSKSYAGDGGFLLPQINSPMSKQSPFKGFLDLSLVTQKIKKAMLTERGEISDLTSPRERQALKGAETHNQSLIQPKNTRFKPQDHQVQMSPKVLETWINETLQDAEHLDIPGVILKPEHKNPISRYGIDRMVFSNAGIPCELIDRVYRALFVYSVGFYELIKKCMQHTEKKYTLITNVWKVFAILLEYCCRTDYRMLISEISREHKSELEKLDRDYQVKFNEQANHEKILRDTNDTLTKYAEELERERANEKQMRQKLEEDYAQNTKNHEEEVQLRLKFESKLNNMHSAHRDLESKYKRVLHDLANTNKQNTQYNLKLLERMSEITQLKTTKAEYESQMAQDQEQLQSLKRELVISRKHQKDVETRCQRALDEADHFRAKQQVLQKENTEMRLQIDVNQSTIDGLTSEIQHMTLELRETKELLKIYEQKSEQLILQLTETNAELNSNKRTMISYTQSTEEKDEKINQLRHDLSEIKLKAEELHLAHGSLTIHHEKVQTQLKSIQVTYEETVDKLHKMNKARHDLETKLTDEIERNRSLQDIVRLKEETIIKRQQEIEDMDRKSLELERALETVEIKKQSLERQLELVKKQSEDKIKSLNEIIHAEKETRDMWIDRYEKEVREHTKCQQEFLQAKSDLKDQILNVKSNEIKLNTANRQIQLLQEQTIKYQHQVNESLSKAENLDRELSTQKEIMRQMEASKREYIEKLKRELDSVEDKWLDINNQNCMVGEDFRSKCLEMGGRIETLNQTISTQEATIIDRQDLINQQVYQMQCLATEAEQYQMQIEDQTIVNMTQFELEQVLKSQLAHLETKLVEQVDLVESLKVQIDKYQSLNKGKRFATKEAQTVVGAAYFNQLSRINQSKENGDKQSQYSGVEPRESMTSQKTPDNQSRPSQRSVVRKQVRGGQTQRVLESQDPQLIEEEEKSVRSALQKKMTETQKFSDGSSYTNLRKEQSLTSEAIVQGTIQSSLNNNRKTPVASQKNLVKQKTQVVPDASPLQNPVQDQQAKSQFMDEIFEEKSHHKEQEVPKVTIDQLSQSIKSSKSMKDDSLIQNSQTIGHSKVTQLNSKDGLVDQVKKSITLSDRRSAHEIQRLEQVEQLQPQLQHSQPPILQQSLQPLQPTLQQSLQPTLQQSLQQYESQTVQSSKQMSARHSVTSGSKASNKRSEHSQSEHEQRIVKLPVVKSEQEQSQNSLANSLEDKLVTLTVPSVHSVTNERQSNPNVMTQAEIEQNARAQQVQEEQLRRQQEIERLHEQSQRQAAEKSNIRKLIKMKAAIQ